MICICETVNRIYNWFIDFKLDPLFSMSILDLQISASSGIISLLILIIAITFFISKSWTCFEVHEIKIQGIIIKPNREVQRIAHHAWAELITRKAGLEFDENHDVVIEIYDSWYELFKELRQLIKDIPSHKLKHDKNVQKLVQTLQIILNQQLRPHLTKWQAKFRKWYDKEENKKDELTPQEIQSGYKEYKDLVTDLRAVNKELVAYTQQLEKLAIGE